MREQLRRDLEKTRDVHRPLPIYYEETREARCEKKPVLETRLLDDMSTLDKWSTSTVYFARRDRDGMRFEEKENLAEIALDSEHVYGESVHSLKFTSPTRLTDLPEENKWSGGGIQCVFPARCSLSIMRTGRAIIVFPAGFIRICRASATFACACSFITTASIPRLTGMTAWGIIIST